MPTKTPSPAILTDPEAYKVDYLLVNTMKTPGLAVLTNPPNDPREWAETAAFALGGARQRFAGNRLATFDFTFVLWLPEHLQQWALFAPLFQRPPLGKQAPVLSVGHPVLANSGISEAVVLTNIGPVIDKTEYKGAFVVKVQMREWKKPLPQPPIPSGSVRAMDGPKSSNDILNEQVEAEGKKAEKNAATIAGLK